MRTFLRTLLLTSAGLGLTLIPFTSAGATPGGNSEPVDAVGQFTVNSLCSFPVTIDAHVVGKQTTVATGQGAIVRTHLVETDIFSANGNTATGSYPFNIKVTVDENGNIVKASQTGIIVRIPLPTGGVFQVSGQADSLAAQTDYISVPTHGVTKGLDELCTYLGS